MRAAKKVIPWILILFLPLWPRHGLCETISLTESRVIDLAVEQNLVVQIAKTDRDIEETEIQRSKSVYDTQLSVGADHLIDKRDQAIPVFGTDNRVTHWQVGIERAFPTGTRAALDWSNQRNSTNSTFADVNPFYAPEVGLSLRQPILKNAFGKQDRGGVTLAKKRFEELDFQTRRRVLEAVYATLFDYWSWVANRANVEVTERSVEEALRFERLAGQKKIFGLYETTDVLAAKANRMEMESQLITAERLRDDALGRLKRGLNLDQDDSVSSQEVRPPISNEGRLEDALAKALAQRSDYKAVRTHVDARKIEVSLAKNRKWPELDLLGSLKLNGVDGGYGGALGEIGGGDHPAYFLGGEFQWPIENRLARSEFRRAEHENRKALYELKDTENRITQEVEERFRAVQSTLKQVEASQEIERAQKEKWELELKKYEAGRSSSDLVIRFQEDYLSAWRRKIVSLFEHRMSVLGLQLAEESLIP